MCWCRWRVRRRTRLPAMLMFLAAVPVEPPPPVRVAVARMDFFGPGHECGQVGGMEQELDAGAGNIVDEVGRKRVSGRWP